MSLRAGERWSRPISLEKGDVISIDAVVVGDQTVDIGLWLEDPAGTVAVPLRRGHSVELRHGAVMSGQYHIIVDNSYSLLAGKVVSVKTTVEK